MWEALPLEVPVVAPASGLGMQTQQIRPQVLGSERGGFAAQVCCRMVTPTSKEWKTMSNRHNCLAEPG